MVSSRALPELGGLESHVTEVAGRLVRRGWPLELVTTDRSGHLPADEQRDGVHVRRFRAWPRSRDYYASPGLFLAVLRSSADLVHVQGIHTLVPPVAMLAAWLRRTPYLVTFHTGGHSSAVRTRLRGLQFRLLGPLLRRAAALVAVSQFEADRFETLLRLPAGSIEVIRNGGSLPVPDTIPEVEPTLLVSPGRLERYKGHHRVVEALPRILEKHPDARLEILGAGPYEAELTRLAARLGVADRVRIELIPPRRRGEMARRLGRAGVVCLISDYEAHPVAVMEALSLGRPVVLARTSGLTEVERAGWAVGVGADADATAVADAVTRQLRHPVVPDSAELPTWHSCVAELEAVYASAAHRGSSKYQQRADRKELVDPSTRGPASQTDAGHTLSA